MRSTAAHLRPGRDELVDELTDAIAARDAAWDTYRDAADYSDAEDRAVVHLANTTSAVAIARQRLALFDRGMPAPARWADR